MSFCRPHALTPLASLLAAAALLSAAPARAELYRYELSFVASVDWVQNSIILDGVEDAQVTLWAQADSSLVQSGTYLSLPMYALPATVHIDVAGLGSFVMASSGASVFSIDTSAILGGPAIAFADLAAGVGISAVLPAPLYGLVGPYSANGNLQLQQGNFTVLGTTNGTLDVSFSGPAMQFTAAPAVPEPGTLALALGGGLLLAGVLRRR